MAIIDDIKNDYLIAEYAKNPLNRCMACAARVVQLLAPRGIPHRVIGVLTWTGLSDLAPSNHYVVVASIAEEAIIIDPTAGQFARWGPFYGSMDDWLRGLTRSLPHRLIKAREFLTMGSASLQVGSHFFGSPMDFDGIVLQNTSWYERIVNNPDAFEKLHQRQLDVNRGSSGFLQRMRSLRCLGGHG